MISNLNQLSFQPYGTIESERVRGCDLAQKAGQRRLLELVRGECPVQVCQSEVWLCNHSNMTVLSVSAEGDSFQHFYLDKVVCIKPGVRFAVHPYQEHSSVEIACSGELREAGPSNRSTWWSFTPMYLISLVMNIAISPCLCKNLFFEKIIPDFSFFYSDKITFIQPALPACLRQRFLQFPGSALPCPHSGNTAASG